MSIDIYLKRFKFIEGILYRIFYKGYSLIKCEKSLLCILLFLGKLIF